MAGAGSAGGRRTVWVAKLGKKFLFVPLLEPATVTPVGVTTLLEASPWSFAIYLPRFAPEGNLGSLGSGDGGALCVFLLFGGIISEPTFAWDQGWHVAEVAGRGVACSLATMMWRAKFGSRQGLR
jgi:hypothetical protein